MWEKKLYSDEQFAIWEHSPWWKPKVRYPEIKGRPHYTEEGLALVPDFIHFYANEESKFAQGGWTQKHCHDWLESHLWIGNG